MAWRESHPQRESYESDTLPLDHLHVAPIEAHGCEQLAQSRGVARNLFWEGIKVFLGRYKTLILMFNYHFDVIFTP